MDEQTSAPAVVHDYEGALYSVTRTLDGYDLTDADCDGIKTVVHPLHWQTIRSALAIAKAVQGGEWKVVPVEPTDEMCRVVYDDGGPYEIEREIYNDMLSAAPSPEGV